MEGASVEGGGGLSMQTSLSPELDAWGQQIIWCI
jgi:hypothetical protein